MNETLFQFENVDVVLAEVEELGYVARLDDMPLLEGAAVEFPWHDARDIVEENPPDRFLNRYFSHHHAGVPFKFPASIRPSQTKKPAPIPGLPVSMRVSLGLPVAEDEMSALFVYLLV